MPPEPPVKRPVVFVDGQNLFHAAREAFGYTYPNYDIRALAERMCAGRGWQLTQARFYTGIPDPQDDPRWHHFWSAKLAVMGRQDVHVYSRSLRYRNRTVHLPMARLTPSSREGRKGSTSASRSTSFAWPTAGRTTSGWVLARIRTL